MNELFIAFLQSPSPDTYRAIRDAVVAHEKYNGYSNDLDQMREAFDAGSYAEFRTLFGEAQPNLLLSPEAHFLLSLTARELGDSDGADAEKFICFSCVEGILGSGDGTRESPYEILRISDEYDVLRFQGKRMQTQSLVHGDDGCSYDQMACDDGSEVWFDITDLYKTLGRQFPQFSG
jgi:hypothetical protein